MDKVEFQQIGETIVSRFPTEELPTYFIPAEGNSSAKGKLYNSYKNYRDQLAVADLITRRAKKRKVTSAEAGSSQNIPNDSVTNDPNESVTVESSLKYIEEITHPSDELMMHWTNTFKYRHDMLITPNNWTASDYFNKFGVLRMADGFKWVTLADIGL